MSRLRLSELRPFVAGLIAAAMLVGVAMVPIRAHAQSPVPMQSVGGFTR